MVYYFSGAVMTLLMGVYVYVYVPFFFLIICLILKLPFIWGSSLVSHFWISVLISLDVITNQLWNLCS